MYRFVHVPALYDDTVVGNPGGSKYFFSTCIRLLQDILDNGVILLDQNIERSVIQSEINAYVGKWPQEYRTKAQELLKQLNTRHRLVVADAALLGNDGNTAIGCRHALAIAKVSRPDAVITPSRCKCCSVCDLTGLSVIPLEHYSLSNFAEARRRGQHLENQYRQRTREEFEQEVWNPLFRDAKNVRILDRVIGHKLNENPSCKNYADAAKDFARGIKWVFDQFVEHSRPNRNRSFEIVCELKTMQWEKDPKSGKRSSQRVNQDILAKQNQILQDFARQLAQDHSGKVPVQMTVYCQGRRSERMPHARFLFTDQVALLVESGFDLLDQYDNVRDVQIKHVQDQGKIETQIRPLLVAPATNMDSLRLNRGR